MNFTIDCKSVEDNNLATSYLAGELEPKRAEAFEEHYLGCDHCWNEVRIASELRASLGRPAVVPLELRSSWSIWSLVAAAAVVAIAAFGTWQLARSNSLSPPEPVLRGSTVDTLTVTTARLSSGQIRISWTPHEEAQTYRVELLRSDGVPVWKRETRETSLTFDVATLPTVSAGVSFVARIEAVDPMGQTVATRETRPLPLD